MKNTQFTLEASTSTEAHKITHQLNINFGEYINQAINFYNKHQKRKLLETQIAYESMLVREESLEVCREFEQLDDALPTI